MSHPTLNTLIALLHGADSLIQAAIYFLTPWT